MWFAYFFDTITNSTSVASPYCVQLFGKPALPFLSFTLVRLLFKELQLSNFDDARSIYYSESKLLRAAPLQQARGTRDLILAAIMSDPTTAEEAAAKAALDSTQSNFFLSSKLIFLLAVMVPVVLLGLFARKLLMSEKEKEIRRLEKKKAKEQRKKK